MATAWHSNGSTAISGKTAWHTNGSTAVSGRAAWHSNGSTAVSGAAAWHADGSTALSGRTSWHADGTTAGTNVDGIWLQIGPGVSVYVTAGVGLTAVSAGGVTVSL